ncbi:BCCT family transporter [Cohaesibacter gelatinilyticus]|uniref:Betaine/carnitine transporter, BCCT family n=1 Tax=Cohaesibacter gelatinilyticus TaxID=372072 RepID=A0A285PGI6_9HYPH|nr:BCCT family transporter [Cohaesibacter gelatinilyticus]SNZ20377.1 betaine/carnitine transporter, BCCT family [Cohaesibacter gelatinilyticus]HAT84826.1 BCCT family transporter [Hyphomicrobiales bacterium]
MVDSETTNDQENDTHYQLGQDNVQVMGLDIHNPVFAISAVVIVAFVVISLLFQESAGAFFGWLRPTMTNTFDWVLLSSANLFVLFSLLLIVTPLGKVRLGGKEARPDYSYAGWFAMLFAAGMGIGLMFFGVSEPLSHYGSSFGGTAMENGVRTDWAPLGGAAGNVDDARQLAMAATIFHWGLHPWAIYAIVALALAFFSYNRGLPLTLRSAFQPILGDRVWGWPGHVIDILGVFATLFGLATSLGLGAEQALAGLNFLFGVPVTGTMKVVLILGITGVALISVVAGLEAGVKRLSEINMVLAIGLLAFIFLLGPTGFIVSGFFENIGAYLREIVPLSNPFGREDQNFMQGWTAFYWAWWISWAPFVGMFIARVSKGRTVREFITCVLIIPTVVSIFWMSTFGGAAIDQVVTMGNEAVSSAAQPVKLFEMVKAFPLTEVLSFVGIVLVIVFFVTSSDSGSLVIDGITAGGKIDAPVVQRVFWAIFEGLIAIALLLGGGLGALQAAAVATGVPFTFVLLGMMVAIFMGLRKEYKMYS